MARLRKGQISRSPATSANNITHPTNRENAPAPARPDPAGALDKGPMTDNLVAVLGGGQLGRMLGLAGIPLGSAFRFLDPSPERARGRGRRPRRRSRSATKPRSPRWRAAPTSSPTSGRACPPTRRASSPADLPVRPGARSLEVSQDRLAEKETFAALGIATPAFAAVDDRAGLDAAVDRRRRLPGRAQDPPRRLRRQGPARAATGADARRRVGRARRRAAHPRVARAVHRELSVLAVRGLDGAVACWPLVENQHEGGILRVSRAPAPGVDADAAGARRGSSRPAPRRPRLRRRARGRAVRRRRRAARQRDRASRAQLRPLDDRGRGDEPVREPPARGARVGRSARPRRADRARCSTASASMPDRATPCSRYRARTSTTTARRRARAASSATSP